MLETFAHFNDSIDDECKFQVTTYTFDLLLTDKRRL